MVTRTTGEIAGATSPIRKLQKLGDAMNPSAMGGRRRSIFMPGRSVAVSAARLGGGRPEKHSEHTIEREGETTDDRGQTLLHIARGSRAVTSLFCANSISRNSAGHGEGKRDGQASIAAQNLNGNSRHK